MKKIYLAPNLNITIIDDLDVIRTSDPSGLDKSNWPEIPNEVSL